MPTRPEPPAPLIPAGGFGGLDGCRAGWVLATILPPGRGRSGRSGRSSAGTTRGQATGGPGPPALVDVRIIATFAEAVALVHDATLATLAVDMPVGLPAAGARPADQDARRRLGPRRSSVFPTPVRATLGAHDYPEALARSRAVDGRGLSKQAFNLLGKIAEVDEAMTPELQARVVECHPEVGFARLAGAPLTTTKHSPSGRAERAALLAPRLRGVDGRPVAELAEARGPRGPARRRPRRPRGGPHRSAPGPGRGRAPR